MKKYFKLKNLNMLIKLIVVLLMLLAIIISGSACSKSESEPEKSTSTNEPSAEVFKVRVHSQMPVGDHITNAMNIFCEESEKMSQGRLKMDHYPAQQLIKSTKAAEMLAKGGVEIAQLPSLLESIVPESRFWNTYGLFENNEQCFKFMHGPAKQYLDEKCQEKGLKLIGYLFYAPNMIYLFKDKVDSLEDFKGKKIRTTGTASASVVKKLGGAPLEMSSSEIYDAMQKGVIDGLWSGYTTVNKRKLYEVGKYIVEPYFGPVPWFIVANLDFWNSLTPDLQKVLLEAAEKAEEYDRDASVKAEEEAKTKFLQEGGWIWDIKDKPEGTTLREIIADSCTAETKKLIGEESFNKLWGFYEEIK